MKSKILKIAGITLLILAAFIWSAPYLFKGKIISLVRSQIYKDLRAHVNFSGADISLFRHFPNIAVGLDNLQVTCVGEFQGDTLLTAKQFDITCDIRSLISGDSIRINAITVNEPRIYARIHRNGHANWNIIKPDSSRDENIAAPGRSFQLALQEYDIHNGYLDYQDEKRDMHVVVINLEHQGRGNFGSDLFTLKTKTTADTIHLNLNGAIPYRLTAKTSIDMVFRVDQKSHTYTFNTDHVTFNDLKFHTEGFFQWINDSSYNMDIKYKVPSTKFKNFLSILPSVYQKDFASIESNGQVNFNGFVKGKYDENHFPAYHANLYVLNGYFKYPDLPVPVEHINLGIQVDNPDGIADHKTINISRAHAEMNHDTLDLHLLVKHMKTKPFIDFDFVGNLDLGNMSKWMKLDSGTRMSGLLSADIHANGNIPETAKQKKNQFQSRGNFDLTNFSFASITYPGGIALDKLLMIFHPKDVLIKELNGEYHNSNIVATGTLNNLYDFALRNKPLNASIDILADEFNLREWVKTDRDGSVSGPAEMPVIVPGNIDFTINAEVDKLHFDNLDLQHVIGNLVISDQVIQLHNIKAKGLDGEIAVEGTYSTLESRESPEIALTYDVKGMDIQKTFFAFNTLRKIMPVAKFMAGNFDAHMSLNGRLHEDMTTNLATLQGEGNIRLLAASLKDFEPLDKLSESLDIAELKDLALKEVKAEFSFKTGKVILSPFLVQSGGIDMGIGGTHGFDQSLDYIVSLKVPRSQLGNKGKMFVKNVVEQAADKGIPVKLNEAVSLNVRMGGTITSPDVNADMDSVVNTAATDLKKEVNDFVNAKLDSAKQQLHHPQAAAGKPLFVQTAYKTKTQVKTKKASASAHKTAVHSKTKKKKKKSSSNYATSLKKQKSTASSSRKRSGL